MVRKLHRIEWLGEVAGGAGSYAFRTIDVRALRRQKYDWDGRRLRRRLELLAHVEAVGSGEQAIEKDQVGPALGDGRFDVGRAVARFDAPPAYQLERQADDAGDIRFVLHDQHAANFQADASDLSEFLPSLFAPPPSDPRDQAARGLRLSTRRGLPAAA